MVVGGIILVLIGLLLQVITLILRMYFFSGNRNITFNWQYYLCIGLSFAGTFPAAVGFYLLTQGPINNAQDYSQILTVVSLLAASLITGFFSFSYQNTRKDEWFLPTMTSICFVGLFYLVFFLLSFFLGASKLTHNIEGLG